MPIGNRKVHTRVEIDIASGEVLEDQFYWYQGPLALCDDDGGGNEPPPSNNPPDPNAGPPPPTTPSGDQTAKEIAELKKQNENLAAEVNKFKESDKKKAEDARRKKAENEGKLKELLDQQDKDLKAAKEENERLQKTLQERGEANLKKLDDDSQKRLNKYKSEVPLSVWLQMVDDEIERSTGNPPSSNNEPDPNDPDNNRPPPLAGGGRQIVNKDGKREMQPQSIDILNRMYRPDAVNVGQSLEAIRDEESGAVKFRKPVQRFFKDMNTYKSANLSVAEAARRGK